MDGFKKQKVRDQVADAICERIQAGEWKDTLPSERWLSEDFGVARDEIHRAILKLRQIGVVTIEGRKNWIVDKPHQSEKLTSVVVLTPQPLQGAGHSFLYCVDQLRARLGRETVPVVVETSVVMSRGAADKRLERVVARHSNAVWVLHRAAPAVQEWFVSQGLPAVVLGSSAANVPLPGVDIDHMAAVRHAMGVLKRAGSSFDQMAFLRPDTDLEGVVRMDACYRSEMDLLGLEPCVVTFREEEGALAQKLTTLFKRPEAVQGILTTSYRAAAFVGGWLSSEKGLVVGRDLSLVSLADGPVLAELYPSVAYYSIQGEALSGRLVRRVSRLLAGEQLGKRGSVSAIPEYVAGDSVCKPIVR